MVKSLLPDDKYRMFLSLFQYPIDTVALTERIYVALEKIFDGRNPVFKYDFVSPNDANDWEIYRNDFLKSLERWKTEGFETMKTGINSVVIVDLPEEQSTPQPEPYFYFLDASNIINFKMLDNSCFEWIMFKQDNDRIAVFDVDSYRIFQLENNEIKGDAIVDNSHDIGYCPARFFWTTPISYRKPIIKRSPISTVLSKLDMCLFFSVGNEHLNLYGRYPIYAAYPTDCDYETDTEHCEGGFLRLEDGSHIIENGSPKKCAICSSKRLDGAGSYVEIPLPEEGSPDLKDPVKVITIDRQSLDYNNEDIANRKNEIYKAVTGFQGTPINNKAVNEDQIAAIFDSLEGALKTPQNNFEQIMEWTDQTLCKLRYGQSFNNASISLGTEHFIMTASQLMAMYDFAKKSSFGVSTLNMLQDRYFETEFKNNPEQARRQRILNNLDPFRHKSNDEVSKMFAANQIEYNDYMLKVNFSSFIMRFERENISVTDFANALDFSTKIDRIKETLLSYANDMKPIIEVIEE